MGEKSVKKEESRVIGSFWNGDTIIITKVKHISEASAT